MEEENLPRKSVVFEQADVQHAADGWKWHQRLCYHLYLVPEDVELKDAEALVYGESMLIEMQNKRKVFLGDVGLLYING